MTALPVTLFTTCKPFRGEAGVMQANALRSWARRGLPVIVVGDEPGVADMCALTGATQVPSVARNTQGTPLLNSLFDVARRHSSSPWLCYLNADILLRADFITTLEQLFVDDALAEPALIVARRRNLPLCQPLPGDEFDPTLDALVDRYGSWDLANAADLFVFHRTLFADLPPLAIGRMQWDNWLLWHARQQQAQVIDASGSLSVLHPLHGYTAHGGDWQQITQGEEAQHNRRHCGANLLTIDEAATHVWVAGQLRDRDHPDAAAVRRCCAFVAERALACSLRYLHDSLDTRPVAESLDSLCHLLSSQQIYVPFTAAVVTPQRAQLAAALEHAVQALAEGDAQRSLQTLQNLLVADLLTRLEDLNQSGRPLLIWGAGQLGRRLQALFNRFQVPFMGFIDSNRQLLNATIGGKRVLAQHWQDIDTADSGTPFVIIASMYYRDIARQLTASGLQPERDFLA